MINSIFIKATIPIFIFSFWFLVGCNSQTNTTVKKQIENDSIDSTNLSGCEICFLITKQKTLNNKIESFEQIKFKDSCEIEYLNQIKHSSDSITQVINNLKQNFNLDENSAEESCSKNYPINYIKNSKRRDSLLLELYGWNNVVFPTFNEICIKTQKEGDKFVEMMKGEKHLFTEEEHDKFIINGKLKTKRIINYRDSIKAEIIKELTGLNTPDKYCIEIMSRYAEHRCNWKMLHDKKGYSQLGTHDPKFYKLVEALFIIK